MLNARATFRSVGALAPKRPLRARSTKAVEGNGPYPRFTLRCSC